MLWKMLRIGLTALKNILIGAVMCVCVALGSLV